MSTLSILARSGNSNNDGNNNYNNNNSPKFPPFITVSNDTVLEYVLADIPFIAVGLLAFGVFTFFFIMRRISKLTIYIHLSAFVAFVAAILDLSQILRRGVINTAHGNALSEVEALIVARELGLAASIGLRLLFFWQFVAEPPRGELQPVAIPDDRRPNFLTINSSSTIHGGSWGKWGPLGSTLKWGLLAMVVAIPVLQAIWRISTEFQRYGPLYTVEGSLQIVVSSVCIMKLLANTWLTPLSPRWRTLRDYSPVIFSLLISAGLGIGNLLCFQFSESSLGRFLQAVEIYILILFVLVSAFYKIPVRYSAVMDLVRRQAANASFEGPSDSSFRTVPPPPPNPDTPIPGAAPHPMLTSRQSTASRIVSSWLMRRLSHRQDGRGVDRDETHLWTQEDAEIGQASVDQKSVRGSSFDQQTPFEPKETANWRDPVYTSVIAAEQPQHSASPTEVQRIKTIVVPPPRARPASVGSGVLDGRSTLPSYYQQSEPRWSLDLPPKEPSSVMTDSPVFGLNGIIRNLRQAEVGELSLRVRESTGMENFRRQQYELERTIQNLHMFSPTTRTSPTGRTSARSLDVPGSRALSESVRSDFSLSNFPEPPLFVKAVSTSIPSPPSPDASFVAQHEENKYLVDDTSFQLVHPRMPVAMAEVRQRQQVPSLSSGQSEMVRPQRFDSIGTQYDVTSFIGNLTTPGPGTGLASSVGTSTGTGKLKRPDTMLSQVSEQASEPLSTVDGGDSATLADAQPGYLTRVQILNSRVAVAPSPLRRISPDSDTSTARVPGSSSGGGAGSVRVKVGLPRGPRLVISSPQQRESAGLYEDRRVFARPRPPPLVLGAVGTHSPRAGGFF